MRYVYLHPIFDERKCAHRFWYHLRNRFQSAGLTLESFDYTGTAEADGEFSEVSLQSLRHDFTEHLACDQTCLIGVRFGASLALDYCTTNQNSVARLILVEPIVDGAAYVDYLRRKQKIKDIMTDTAVTDLDEDGFENIEGYKTSTNFIEQLKNFNLAEPVQTRLVSDCVYLLQTAKGSQLDSELQLLHEALKNADNPTIIEKMSIPIFWERIGSADYTLLTKNILRWCRG